MRNSTGPMLAVLLLVVFGLACGLTSPQPAPTPFPTEAPTHTATSTSTTTPVPSETPTPSATPTATLEPAPYEGWKKLASDTIEIWLPGSFEGGNLQTDLPIIVARIRGLGPEFEAMAQLIEMNPEIFVLWAGDTQTAGTGFLTNVNVTTETVLSFMTIETYMDSSLQQLPAQFVVLEQEIVTIAGRQAGRILIEFELTGVKGNQAMYVMQEGNRMWVTTFATAAAEFEDRLPIFDQSANTIVIAK